MGEMKNAYKILVGYFLEKLPLESLRKTWGNNRKMDLRKVGCKDGIQM